MAIRVTEQEVLDIMDSGIEVSSTQMTAMITAASSVIDNVFADDSTVTDALLKELERWLSAHYVASTLARMAEKEKVGQADVPEFADLFLDGRLHVGVAVADVEDGDAGHKIDVAAAVHVP